MEDNRKELIGAFEKAFDAEIDEFIAAAEKEPHEFSKEFENKMDELIRTGKPNNKTISRKRARRIVLIAVAAVLALALAACAIPQVREFIAGFFVQHKGDHDEYTEPAITKERIEEEYGLVPIPEGFEFISENNTERFSEKLYANADGDVIVLHQSANTINIDVVDNENGELYEYETDGKTVRIYLSEESASASWIENGYYFSLDYGLNIGKNIFEEWVRSVNQIEDNK